MSESSTRHADGSWPHPASEAARLDGQYAPDPQVPSSDVTDDPTGTMHD